MTETIQATDTALEVAVTAHDLPLHCPQPGSPLWARHPRVFLDVLKSGNAACPYCGTRYTFTGERPHGHH
ncbi:MAG: zinc-finger domain-containing protein [Georgfuchsia sp.]